MKTTANISAQSPSSVPVLGIREGTGYWDKVGAKTVKKVEVAKRGFDVRLGLKSVVGE